MGGEFGGEKSDENHEREDPAPDEEGRMAEKKARDIPRPARGAGGARDPFFGKEGRGER